MDQQYQMKYIYEFEVCQYNNNYCNNIFLMNDWIDKYSTVILLPTINAEKVRNKQSGYTQLFILTVP